MGADSAHLSRATRRIERNILWIAAAGVVTALLWKGLPAGFGFTAGALGAWLSFHFLHQFVETLGSDERSPRKRLVVFLALRYLAFGVAGYVIVKYFKLNVSAILAGLLVSVAAVIVEILYELLYARA